MRPLVDVRGLSFRYNDGTVALHSIDFQLFPGESVALFGPNGSGKTTFILHLNGILSGEGSIEICGLPVTRDHLAVIRRNVGVVFQDSESQLFMPSVLEDVAFGPLNLGLSASEAAARARAALEQVGMSAAEGRAPYHLSAGEKKRVAIAGILAMQPDLLALDEPTTFLDPPAQRALADLLRELPQPKILASHDVAFARAICSRAVFFENGKIIADGPVDQIANQFGWDFSLESPRPLP